MVPGRTLGQDNEPRTARPKHDSPLSPLPVTDSFSIWSFRRTLLASPVSANIPSENAPLAVEDTRATLRAGLAAAVKAQTDKEFVAQDRLRQTEDYREGVRAVAERRPGRFMRR